MIPGFLARLRSLWSGISRGHAIDEEMQDEFRHHIELRAADLVRSGVEPREADRRARAEFGGAYNHKEAGREARGLRWFDALRVSTLDIRLGARMLGRYPGLTVVGAFAMGIAIAIGAGVFGAITLLKDPTLPLDEGDRIVGIQVWSVRSNNPERRIVREVALWKSELRSVRDLGAFRSVVRNLVSPDGRAESARAAAISASGFRVARVQPLLGRYLVDADEQAGAPDVVVLSHDLWRSRFAADSAIVGNTVLLGGVAHTVVGVMPPGFAFPVNYQLWVPLRLDPLAVKPREGPVVFAFGRLAPDATLEDARSELATAGTRMARDFPATHQYLVPRVLPFAQSWFELDSVETQLMFAAAQVAVTLLLVIICVNIAILVYARTATRQGEIAVRSALGASRGRIVTQLFGEALVFAGIGAVIGLAIISVVTTQLESIFMQTDLAAMLPFWIRLQVSPATVAYAVGLALLAAAIIGVLPALQVTGRRVQASLQRLSGGHSTLRMGRTWTTMIIVEVALTVAILPTALFVGGQAIAGMTAPAGFAAEEYLKGVLSMDRDPNLPPPTADEQREFERDYARNRDELIRRISQEGGVAAVTWVVDVPGTEQSARIEVAGSSAEGVTTETRETLSAGFGDNAPRVRRGYVAPDLFDVLGVPVLGGRTFGPADADTTAASAVVNRAFVETLLRGRNAIGAQFRTLSRDSDGEEVRGPWQQIVGVVENFPTHVDYERPRAVWYGAAGAGRVYPSTLAIRTPGSDPENFAPRFRALAAEVSPALQVRAIKPIDDAMDATHMPLRLMAMGLIAVTLSVLVLASAGLYSLMTVTVTQRRREIGIRIALGADRRRVLSSIFSRAALQVGTGTALGLTIGGIAASFNAGEMSGYSHWIILPGVALLMLIVGALSTFGPARRGLGIQPAVVLKED